jgi:hypothetical protein
MPPAPARRELLRTPFPRHSRNASPGRSARTRAAGGGAHIEGFYAEVTPTGVREGRGELDRDKAKAAPDAQRGLPRGLYGEGGHAHREKTRPADLPAMLRASSDERLRRTAHIFARRAKGRSRHVGAWPLRVAQRRHGTKHEVAGACARWLLLRRTSQNPVWAKFAEDLYIAIRRRTTGAWPGR